MEDEDFLRQSQSPWTQQRSNSRNLSQMVTSTVNPSPSGSQVRPSQPNQARSQPSFQVELSQIQDGLRFLTDRIQQISGDRGIKRPTEPKPNIKEECQICHKLYANKTTLFRHYQGIHKEMNPERFHGCSVNNTVVSLDASFREIQCSICAYVAPTQSALDAHNRTTHSNVVNANASVAPTQNTINSNVPANNTATANSDVINNVNNGDVKGKMHKCEECACYFEEKSKFDEHMKVQHGFEVVCKICNKNFLFEDIDGHVKEKHPDIYNKKRKDNVEKIIVEKIMKNKRGNRVHVFICTKCDTKMYDKMQAERHARGHKKGLKIKVAPRNKVSNAEESIAVVSSNDDNVILTCTNCDISTGSYDAAVEHSQNHITNNIQFVTQICEICDLKFEPLCYKKHIDLHYRNKEIYRDSFKYFKYRHEFLAFENWFNCFDMAEPLVKKMISESIYAHTRSVKMRVLHEGSYRLYKCCKCDNFVEPAAVYNHTVNYDTCVKVKCRYACNICKRTFNNRLARNNHTKNHKSEEAYKIVLFNHENDKKINEALNANKLQNTASTSNGNLSKVLYKCLCGLCFVTKETADKHTIICPGKDAKNPCLKCNYFFIQEELVVHAFEHHQNGVRIVIENITPEVIVVDSDEEIIEIDSSDEDDAQNECLNNIQISTIKTDNATTIQCSSDEAGKQKIDRIEMAAADACVRNEESMALEAATLHIEKTETDEDKEKSNHEFGEINYEITDDDESDETISYENTDSCSDEITQGPDVNKQGKLKLVAPNLLINPFHDPFENGFLKVWDMGALNREINTDIENIREQIEATTDKPSNEIAIKKEKSWMYDPTDFSHISKRQTLRQEMCPSSSNLLVLEVESLLTDDEETDINQDNEDTGNNVSSIVSTVHQTINDINDEKILKEISHITNHNDTHETLNNIEEMRDRTIVDNENNAQIELNKNGVNIYNSTRILNEEVQTNEDYNSDDDLFLPSLPPGIENREYMELRNNQKEIPKDMGEEQLHLSHETIANDTTNVETQNSTENPETTEHSTRSENEKNVSIDADSVVNRIEIDNDKVAEYNNIDSRPSVLEDTPSNTNIVEKYKDSRPSFVEYTPKTTIFAEKDRDSRPSAPKDTTTTNINDISNNIEVVSNKPPENQIVATNNIINIKREFQYIDINIKRELIEENGNTENSCDKDNLVQIKIEPNYNSENVYNGNKKNDLFDTENVNNVNCNNNCSIV